MRQFPTPVFDDALDERRQREQALAQRREALRQRVRESFPETTRFADNLREVFGEVRIVWAAEQGNIIGRVPEPVLADQQQQFGRLRDVGKEQQ